MFHIYDVDGDGIISKQDLNGVVSAVHNLIGSSGPNENHAINNQVRRIFEVGFSFFNQTKQFFLQFFLCIKRQNQLVDGTILVNSS